MAKYYCILFDADNTLLNFDAAENKALAETLVNYGIEPDAETVQTYRTINEELWRQLEKGQIRREKLFGERFSRFLKAINAAGDGVEMNRYYLEQLSTHPDLMSPEVLDVLRELSEVATLAIVSNGAQKVQTRRLAESGVMNFMEDVFISEKMGCEKPNARIFDAALRAGCGEPGARSDGGRQPVRRYSGRQQRRAGYLLVQPQPRREPRQGDPYLRDRQSGRAVSAGDGAGGAGQCWPEEPPPSVLKYEKERITDQNYADTFGKTG